MKAIENIGIRHRYLTQTWMFKPEEVPENYWDGEEWQQKIVFLMYSWIKNTRKFLNAIRRTDKAVSSKIGAG